MSEQKDIYTVFDEMAMSELLRTDDKTEAQEKAYNHQCILMKNGKVLKDYSCDW